MDVYWSIERCGWVPCTGAVDPPASPWSLAAEPDASPEPVPDVPLQRMVAQAPAER